MNPPVPPPIPSPERRRRSIFLKPAGIGALILALHIPLVLTHGVLTERREYQHQAIEEIAGIWGREQRITGPVLAVPYVYGIQVTREKFVGGTVLQVEETQSQAAIAFFLPETLSEDAPVETEVRHRGIYDAVVYSTKVRLAGLFQPDFVAAGIEADRIDWNKSRVLFGVSDLRGLRSVSPLQIAGGEAIPFETADGQADGLLPLAAKVEKATAGAKINFTFEVAVQGSERLQVTPVGRTTAFTIESAWPDPSFCGAYLPVKRQVTASGFKAEWEVSHFSRGFPQSWTSRSLSTREISGKIHEASFGVAFAQPVDGYRLAERAEKYGLLFFVLVFAVFFLFEMTADLIIHPLQYALVGAGMCLFFLGFLALSEFMVAGLAYGIAATACTAAVSLYSWSFLQSGPRTLVILGGLSATYGYLYFVLKSQDYALLAGTAALFVALALVMFCTRRINWYGLEASR